MSVSGGRISRVRVTATVVIALILAVLPLPDCCSRGCAGWPSTC
jgi:hypothetical protein